MLLWINFRFIVVKSQKTMVFFLVFQLEKTSWACLLGSLIFQWQAHLLIFTKSLFNSFAVIFGLWITENNEVSSPNNFPFEDRQSARSFICMKNSSGPSKESWGTSVLTSAQEEVCPLSTSLCFSVSFKKLTIDLKGYQICHSVSVW